MGLGNGKIEKDREDDMDKNARDLVTHGMLHLIRRSQRWEMWAWLAGCMIIQLTETGNQRTELQCDRKIYICFLSPWSEMWLYIPCAVSNEALVHKKREWKLAIHVIDN